VRDDGLPNASRFGELALSDALLDADEGAVKHKCLR
jgi:hypothetical protein